MTIDTNTVLMTLMGAITIYFAYGFFKSRLDEKFNAFSVRLDQADDAWWREHERLTQRMASLERCCREQSQCGEKYPAKNHYNTGV
jgi:hypothetical protein